MTLSGIRGIRATVALTLALASGSAHPAGSTAMDSFNFVTGARAAGMGGAVAASVDDVSGLQWNPAALAGISAPQVAVSHLFWVAGINYSHMAAGMPVPLGTAGLSLQYIDFGTIESTRDLADAVSAEDIALTAGWGAPLAAGFRGGASIKGFRHNLAGAVVYEAAADIGGRYEMVPGALEAGAVLQNLGYSGKLNGLTPPLPTTLKMGFAYRFRTSREPAAVADPEAPWEPVIYSLLEADVIMYQRGEPAQLNVGAEMDISSVVFVRLGYLQGLRNAGDGAGLSVGAGFKLMGLGLDYAYGSVGDLGNGQYVTLSWTGKKLKAN